MKPYKMLLFIIVAFLAGMVISSLTNNKAPGTLSFEQALEQKMVTKVIDGDTVIADGESVRLLGIDTDERGYPCYTEAKKRLEALVLNRDVLLEADTEDKDMYGRYLRFIFLDGKNINLQMVGEGLAIARFSPDNQKYKQVILAAEKQAKENQIGCKWSGLE